MSGLWLYEAPWSSAGADEATTDLIHVTQVAHLRGFSTSQSSRSSSIAAAIFPQRGSRASEADVVLEAIAGGRAAARVVGGFDLFGQLDYTAIAEPIGDQTPTRQVLLTAVRNDCLLLLSPWLQRLAIPEALRTFQRL